MSEMTQDRAMRKAASSRQQTDNEYIYIDAFLRCSKRCGSCPPDLPSFDELLEDTDDKLFNKINNDVEISTAFSRHPQ